MTSPVTTVVVPTVGRSSLSALCGALARQSTPVDAPVVLVDDRPSGRDLMVQLAAELGPDSGLDLRVVRSGGGGPARARNIGWRHARTPWVSFLDDDVVPAPDWYATLLRDLEKAHADDAAGSAGRVQVPLPPDRRPTDWERGTAGLETSRWITADLCYRRSELSAVGGFDERFPRAFREDADLALRLGGDRGRILQGERRTTHPVRPADDWASLRQQAGNADDYLMRALHGPDWHQRAQAPVGRRARHVATTMSGVLGLAGLLARAPRLAALGLAGWLVGTGELAWARIAPGPRDRTEVRRMLLTSAAIPAAATYHSVRGVLGHRNVPPWRGLPELVLLDRDGTLVHDVPYNGDPERVSPVDGARAALDRLRAEGIRLAVVSNQSAVAKGLVTREDVDAVNARVSELLGPFEAFEVCPHDAGDGCACRKPAPGLLERACAEAGVDPARAVMIGDIGADVQAAAAAGVRAVLVPTPETRVEEVRTADRVAPSLADAVSLVLEGDW
jgi:histidinol-phosphate phosphatase family protein